jgi:hypothetical protein
VTRHGPPEAERPHEPDRPASPRAGRPPGLPDRRIVNLPAPGRRVVVRYLLPSGQATDALGELLSADAETLVVDGKRGIERIPRGAVIAAKEVPPPPAPRAPRSTSPPIE